jgi:restriction system protein
MAKDKLSRSRVLAANVIFAALQILKEMGGQAPAREVIAEVEKRVALDEWDRATYEKSGYVRWQSILYCFSIDCIKAGYLVKKKVAWHLALEGDNALKLGEVGLSRLNERNESGVLLS